MLLTTDCSKVSCIMFWSFIFSQGWSATGQEFWQNLFCISEVTVWNFPAWQTVDWSTSHLSRNSKQHTQPPPWPSALTRPDNPPSPLTSSSPTHLPHCPGGTGGERLTEGKQSAAPGGQARSVGEIWSVPCVRSALINTTLTTLPALSWHHSLLNTTADRQQFNRT